MDLSVFVRSHVERCLSDMLGVCRVGADEDGDYSFRSGSAACYVRVEDEPVMVRVFAVAVTGVKRSAGLLKEINQTNVRSRTAQVTWQGQEVVVSQVMIAEAFTAESLAQACKAVAQVANDIGAMIAAVFGGATPFSPLDDEARSGADGE